MSLEVSFEELKRLEYQMVSEPKWLCKQLAAFLLVCELLFLLDSQLAERGLARMRKEVEIEEASERLMDIAQHLEQLDRNKLTESLYQLLPENADKDDAKVLQPTSRREETFA